MRLRIVTLNVWNTEGEPGRLKAINMELRRLDPDLVAFQEVMQTADRKTLDMLLEGIDLQRTHQADVQHFLAPFSDRYGGSAVATRWPHQAVEVLDLRLPDAADVPWATLAVVVQLPDLGELLFIGATAAWRPNGEAARERQAIMVADLDARHRRELPTLIAGDFNANPDAGSIRFLTGRQSLQGRSVLYTTPGRSLGKAQAIPGLWTTRTRRPAPSKSSVSHTIAAVSIMYSSAAGTRTPRVMLA
jgi:endonuclease/exonuclease/phosphatase family metal-dependent hydrolase